MQINNFARRKTVQSAADIENVCNNRNQIIPYKIMFMVSMPRNGGHSEHTGTWKMLRHGLDLSQQKSLALSPGMRGIRIPQPQVHHQDLGQESTGSGGPSLSTDGQIVHLTQRGFPPDWGSGQIPGLKPSQLHLSSWARKMIMETISPESEGVSQGCYISCQLLFNKLPQTWQLKATPVYYLIGCVRNLGTA